MAEQMPDRKKIFISHSSQDSDIAEKLCRELEKKGFGCWIFTRDVNVAYVCLKVVTRRGRANGHGWQCLGMNGKSIYRK